VAADAVSAVVAFSLATDVSTYRDAAFDAKALVLTLRPLLLSSFGFRPSSLKTVSNISVGSLMNDVILYAAELKDRRSRLLFDVLRVCERGAYFHFQVVPLVAWRGSTFSIDITSTVHENLNGK
jgi:hypothetical protein